MTGTRVPKTTIDEYCYPRRRECNIRTPRKFCIVCSEAKATAMQFAANQHCRTSGRAVHPLHLYRHCPVQGCGSCPTHMTSLTIRTSLSSWLAGLPLVVAGLGPALVTIVTIWSVASGMEVNEGRW